ncbi:hypothetical protein Dimus_004904 [Dionaea muscipula]
MKRLERWGTWNHEDLKFSVSATAVDDLPLSWMEDHVLVAGMTLLWIGSDPLLILLLLELFSLNGIEGADAGEGPVTYRLFFDNAFWKRTEMGEGRGEGCKPLDFLKAHGKWPQKTKSKFFKDEIQSAKCQSSAAFHRSKYKAVLEDSDKGLNQKGECWKKTSLGSQASFEMPPERGRRGHETQRRKRRAMHDSDKGEINHISFVVRDVKDKDKDTILTLVLFCPCDRDDGERRKRGGIRPNQFLDQLLDND